MSQSRYRFGDQSLPHFLTCTVVDWLPVFTRPAAVDVILDSWRFLQQKGRMTLFAFVILENHLHFIASSENLPKEVAAFKSFTARKIIDMLHSKGERRLLEYLRENKGTLRNDQEYQFWQDGSHPVEIANEDILLQKLEYIHMNPVRRGYVDEPIHWRYSSARNYFGMVPLLDVFVDWRLT